MKEAELKAKELVEKFVKVVPDDFGGMDRQLAKECAFIAVEEVKQAIPMYTGNINPTWLFWNEVKNELNKM